MTQQLRPIQRRADLLQIQQQVVDPQRGPLAHGGGLRRLVMGVGKAGQVLVPQGEITEIAHHARGLRRDQTQRVAHDDQIRVVAHVAGRRAQMDDRLRGRAAFAEGQHVRHHVVPHRLLMLRGPGVIDVVDVRAHLVDLRLRNGQPQLPLRLRQRDPQPPPDRKLHVRRKQRLHLPRGVPRGERGNITFAQAHHLFFIIFNNIVAKNKQKIKQMRKIIPAAPGFSKNLSLCPNSPHVFSIKLFTIHKHRAIIEPDKKVAGRAVKRTVCAVFLSKSRKEMYL